MLHRPVLARQHLRQQLLEQRLAEAAADLRRLQHLLEALDVTPDLDHALRRLAELAERALHVAHDACGGVEALAHHRLRTLDEAHAFLQLTCDLAGHRLQLGRHLALQHVQLVLDGDGHGAHLASEAVLTIASLLAHRLDLLLEHRRRRVRRRRPRAQLPELAARRQERPRDHRQHDDQPAEEEAGDLGHARRRFQ